MPGVAAVGARRNAEWNRPTALPAEARSLSRMLRILKSPQTAATALTETLEKLPRPEDPRQLAALSLVRSQVFEMIEDMAEGGWSLPEKHSEYNMAMAVEAVLQEPSSFDAPEKPRRQLGSNGMDGGSCGSGPSQISPVNYAIPFDNMQHPLVLPWTVQSKHATKHYGYICRSCERQQLGGRR
jgi:hypothetical protein